MKISKLFHWLYAILMLLPFAFFVPSVLYYAFNDNSTMQNVEVPKTETIAVDFNQYFLPDEVNESVRGIVSSYENYRLTVNGTATDYFSRSYNLVLTDLHVTRGHKYYFRFYDLIGTSNFEIYINYNYTYDYASSRVPFIFTSSIDSNVNAYLGINFFQGDVVDFDAYVGLYDLTQMFGSGNEPTIATFDEMFPLDYYEHNQGELMQITYDTGETEQLVSNTDIINYAWESIWDLPLFNWCKVSFVSVPFTYITGLFGLAASNSFNYVFTYFASMSIIWLVFDVIMYVPLLVHRWLDKGIVE